MARGWVLGQISMNGATPMPTDFLFWWKADTLSLSDGDPVASWVDSTSNAWDAVQATAGKKPTYHSAPTGFNGLPALQFAEGSHSQVAVPYTSGLNPSEFTIFVVMQPADMATNPHFFLTSGNPNGGFGDGYQLLLGSTTPGLVEFIGWPSGSDFLGGVVPAGGATHWICMSTDGTDGNGYLDGTPDGLNPQTGGGVFTPTVTYPFVIGSGFSFFGGEQSYDGYIAEIIGYSRVLSADERGAVDDYIKARYGL